MFLQKEIDFTQPGGYPFTQDTLKYMQEATGEAIGALAGLAGDIAGPMAISGMVISEPVPGDVAVSAGWCLYNGKMVKFAGGTVTPAMGEVALVLISNNVAPKTFQDGSTPDVILDTTGTLIAAATVTDATHFPVADMVPVKPIWDDLTPYLDGGFDPGTAPRVNIDRHGRVNLQGDAVSNLSGAATICLLPARYRPDADRYFTVTVLDGSPAYVQKTVVVLTDGNVVVLDTGGLATGMTVYLDAIQYLKD